MTCNMNFWHKIRGKERRLFRRLSNMEEAIATGSKISTEYTCRYFVAEKCEPTLHSESSLQTWMIIAIVYPVF